MTTPYGTDPGSYPQGLGDPQNQGPQFVAPGSYGTPGTPGAYGTNEPPGSTGLPGAYGSSYPLQPSPPYPPGPPQPGYQYPQPYSRGFSPRPTRLPTRALIVLMVLAVIAAGIIGGYELNRKAIGDPVTQPTPTLPTRSVSMAPPAVRVTAGSSAAATNGTECTAGDRITTDLFVATVPANWSCDGDEGDVSITSTRSDAIWVEHATSSADPRGDCRAQLEGLGDLTALPQESWGGRTALAYQTVDRGDIFGVRCVVVGTQTWYLMYFPLDAADDAAVRADVTALVSTWVWR